jgi:hypothetical protein
VRILAAEWTRRPTGACFPTRPLHRCEGSAHLRTLGVRTHGHPTPRVRTSLERAPLGIVCGPAPKTGIEVLLLLVVRAVDGIVTELLVRGDLGPGVCPLVLLFGFAPLSIFCSVSLLLR